MNSVQFINIEDDEPDLILSFALDDERLGIKSLILLRTPVYESLLPENERGVNVSMEGDEDLKNNLLEEISIENGTITVSALRSNYKLDTSRIENKEIDLMLKFIGKLNYDSSFKVSHA